MRIPFLAAVFPQSIFVYLHREPEECLAAMLAAWESGDEVSHPELPGWRGPPWSLLLTPEWRTLAGKDLPELVTEQWRMATRILLDDLERLPPARWCIVDAGALPNDPGPEIERVCEFAGLPAPESIAPAPPAPAGDARLEAELAPHAARTEELGARAREWIARSPDEGEAGEPAPVDLNSPNESPLRSVNSSNLTEILRQLASSLMITTYQAGKLVAIRRDGDGVNTHFRQFDSPMGLDLRGGRLAIGTRSQVFEFHNIPTCWRRCNRRGKHDACFVPRRIPLHRGRGIHDIAWVGDELWFVNTRFSCLATLDDGTASSPAGGRASSPRSPPRTAATSTASAWSTTGPLRHRAGDQRRGGRLAREQGARRCGHRRAEQRDRRRRAVDAALPPLVPRSALGARVGRGRASAGSTSTPAASRRSPSCPASPAASPSPARSPSSGSRRSASRPPSAASR